MDISGKMKPKIAFGLFDFHIGGIETFLYNIALALQDKYEFYFLATSSSQIAPHFNEVGTALYAPPQQLEKILKRIQPDIFQVHNEQAQINCAINAGIKNIIERTDGTRSVARLKKDKLKLVIASAKGTIPLIQKVAPAKLPIELIYNGVDLNRIDSEEMINLYPQNEFVIGRSSRFGWGKNIQLLIEAVKKLSNEIDDIRLCIIGGDSVLSNAERNEPKLKALAKGYEKYIQFLGHQNNVIPYTKRFNIGTCVSRPNNEGIPNSLMESMVCSKPVIGTDVDQISELINKTNGILIKDNDLDGLMAAIQILYKDRELCKKLGIEARKTIENEFNMIHCMEKYDKIYESLLN